MKTFMLVGDVSNNVGPSNVHRELIEHWPSGEGLLLPCWSNKLFKLASVFISSMLCDVLLTTGTGRLAAMAASIARKRGVPVVVLVHGYLPYENEVNKLGLPSEVVQEWRAALRGADVVVTNSEYHAGCLRAAEPDIANKVRWFNLGIKPFAMRRHVVHEDRLTVTVSGGTRPIKGNEIVARAVALLQEWGYRVDLLVFGDTEAENQQLKDAVRKCGGQIKGQLTQAEFLGALAQTDVFVMNSRRDAFGMSATDALAAGASLLLSCNCGVAGVLALEESDIVFDCEDANEVAQKILHLVSHPNAQRLYGALDFDALGWDASANRLCEICHDAIRLGAVG